MLTRMTLAIAALGLLMAACSSGNDVGVASLGDTSDPGTVTETTTLGDVSDEEALLAFASCMRDNGLEGFEDPQIDADGSIEFAPPGGTSGEIDREALRAARDACSQHLEGLAFGPGSVDRSEIEDQLVQFAACMRENGIDVPDPDFSGEPGQGSGRGPFGDLDTEDPAFEEALGVCQEEFGGQLRIPGRGGGRG